MPSKKTIILKLSELKARVKELEDMIEEHYGPKDTVLEDSFADLKVHINTDGWTFLTTNDRGIRTAHIAIGKYPCARWELIEKALEHVKNMNKKVEDD